MTGRVENIVARGVRRRRVMGVVVLVVAIVAAVLLIALDAPRGWRVALVVPFAISANGFLQARDKTCVALAAAGQRECEDGTYARVSDEARALARRQATWIIARAALIAVVLTALVWLI